MDQLSIYIQNGKELTLKKIFIVFMTLTLVWGGVIYALMTYLVKTPDMQQFLDDIPVIEMSAGQVITPADTVWQKALPMTDAVLYIDTTKDSLTSFPEPTAFYLTRRKVYMAVRGQVQEEDLPTENILINHEAVLSAVQSLVPRITILIAGLTFLFLWIGMAGTYFLSRLFLGFREKPTDKEIVKRAGFVGWLSVFGLNVVLLCIGHGLGLFGAILTASIISIFSVIYSAR